MKSLLERRIPLLKAWADLQKLLHENTARCSESESCQNRATREVYSPNFWYSEHKKLGSVRPVCDEHSGDDPTQWVDRHDRIFVKNCENALAEVEKKLEIPL